MGIREGKKGIQVQVNLFNHNYIFHYCIHKIPYPSLQNPKNAYVYDNYLALTMIIDSVQ